VSENKEILKKVISWRLCSILITLMTIWIIEGDIKEATYLTFFLHFILIISHWIFEHLWEGKRDAKRIA